MSGNHIVYGIKIAGLGATNSDLGGDVDPADYATTPDKDTLLYRICTSISDQDPAAQVAKPLLAMPPDEVGYEIRPWEAASITGSLSVALQLSPDTLAWFTRQSFPLSARLITTLDSTSTTVYTDDYDWIMEGTYQFVGRECIYFHTAEATPGHFSVSRGQLFTAAQPHIVSPAYDTGIYAAVRPHNLPGRRVEVVRWVNGTGLLEDVEEYVWSGVIRHYRINYQTLTIDLECASLEDVIREGEICLSPWTGKLTDEQLYGLGANRTITAQGGVYASVYPDRAPLQSVDLEGVTESGGVVTYTYAVCSDGEVSFFARFIDNSPAYAPLANSSDSYPTTLSTPREILSNTIHEVYDLTSTATSLAELIHQLLVRQDDRGLGVDPALISSGFIQKGVGLLPASAMPDSLIVGVDGPVNVYELITSLLSPYLVTLITSESGVLDLLPYVDRELLGGGSFSSDDVVLGSVLDYDPIAVPPAAKIRAKVGEYTGSKRVDNITVIAPQVRDRYLESFASTAELRILGRTDLDVARDICTNYAAYRSQARGIIAVSALADKDFAVGGTVRTTLEDIPDEDGSVASGGMSGETCTILSRAYNHDTLSIDYKLLRGGGGGKGSIHLSAEVISYSSGNCYITPNRFIPGPGHSQGWADDLEAWNAALQLVFDSGGYQILVDVLDENLAYKGVGQLYQVFLGVSGYLALDGVTATPIAGDYIVPRDYDAATGSDDILFRYFNYIADDSGNLGAGNAPAYRWSF